MARHYLSTSNLSPTDQWSSITSPYSGKLLGEVELANCENIEQALRITHARFLNKKLWLGDSEKIFVLEKAAIIVQEHFDELADIALSEGGKPLADTRVEINRAIDGIRSCIECIRSNSGKEVPMGITPSSKGRLAVTRNEPIGVVLAISAFNHPLNLIVHQIVPAIAAGCPVIVKPAGDTALSCFRFVEILKEAGLPKGYCIPLLPESRDVTGQLVSDKRIAFMSFIGSASVGWSLKSKLAPGTRCALEHGGVAPVIVEKDADLSRALPAIAKGGFYHAGQVCVSVQRVFVHSAIAEEFVSKLAKITCDLTVGDPTEMSTEVGPLIRKQEVERVASWVDEAINQGAELITGGKKLSDVFYQPTLLLNPPEHAKVSTDEVFGPVISIYTYDDLDEALARANSLSVAFQAAVFTQDIDRAMYVQSNLDAATVMVNDHTAFRVDWMPFAGLKESGYGVGGIPYTYEEMQTRKLLVINSPGLL